MDSKPFSLCLLLCTSELCLRSTLPKRGHQRPLWRPCNHIQTECNDSKRGCFAPSQPPLHNNASEAFAAGMALECGTLVQPTPDPSPLVSSHTWPGLLHCFSTEHPLTLSTASPSHFFLLPFLLTGPGHPSKPTSSKAKPKHF